MNLDKADYDFAKRYVGAEAFQILSEEFEEGALIVACCISDASDLIGLPLREPNDPEEARMLREIQKAHGLLISAQ